MCVGAQMEQNKEKGAAAAFCIPRTNFIYYSLSLLYAKQVDYKGMEDNSITAKCRRRRARVCE